MASTTRSRLGRSTIIDSPKQSDQRFAPVDAMRTRLAIVQDRGFVDAESVEQRRGEVLRRDRVVFRMCRVPVALAMNLPATDSAAGEQAVVAERPMVPAGAPLV